MSLWLKVAGGVVLIAVAVVAGLFVLGIGNDVSPQLTSLVKNGEEVNRTRSGSQTAQSGANSAKLDWQVSCKGDRESSDVLRPNRFSARRPDGLSSPPKLGPRAVATSPSCCSSSPSTSIYRKGSGCGLAASR